MMYEGLSRVDSTPTKSMTMMGAKNSFAFSNPFTYTLEFFKAPSSIKRLPLIIFTVYPTYSTTTGSGLDSGKSERN